MSRVTPPVTKLSHAVRALNSTSRQSGLRAALPLKSAESTSDAVRRSSKQEADHDSRLYHTQTHTLPPHRPTSIPTITIPLMQGFRTSAPRPPLSSHTIDFITLPTPPRDLAANPFSRIRVPLLPDNYSPDRSASSAHAVETTDAALNGPEIHIVAANPETVAVLSEIEGNDAEEGSWGVFALREAEVREEKDPGVLKELWSGVVDDIFGKGGAEKPKLAG